MCSRGGEGLSTIEPASRSCVMQMLACSPQCNFGTCGTSTSSEATSLLCVLLNERSDSAVGEASLWQAN